MRFKLFIVIAILSSLLLVGNFGLVAMTEMEEHHELGCPFMLGEQIICTMTTFDHIDTWQGMFTGMLTVFVVYALLAIAIAFIWKYDKPPDYSVKRRILCCTKKPALVSLYRELFSRGILNPKAP